jgi:hypothetical protein
VETNKAGGLLALIGHNEFDIVAQNRALCKFYAVFQGWIGDSNRFLMLTIDKYEQLVVEICPKTGKIVEKVSRTNSVLIAKSQDGQFALLRTHGGSEITQACVSLSKNTVCWQPPLQDAGFSHVVDCAKFSPNNLFIAACLTNIVAVFKVSTGKMILSQSINTKEIDWFDDSTRVAFNGNCVFNVKTGVVKQFDLLQMKPRPRGDDIFIKFAGMVR